LNNLNVSDEKLNALMQMAANKLGQDPETLKQQLQSGNLDDITKNMDPKAASQLGNIINNPKAIEALLGSDKIRSILGRAGSQK